MDAANNSRQIVVFKLANEEYGIDILRVREIKQYSSITRVPKAPHYVKGVVNLRGDVIPIVDLRKKFNLPDAEVTDSTRIIIVNVEDITIGLIVDSSSETLDISKDSIEDAPDSIGSVEQGYINGIGKVGTRLVILLDVSKIIGNSLYQ